MPSTSGHTLSTDRAAGRGPLLPRCPACGSPGGGSGPSDLLKYNLYTGGMVLNITKPIPAARALLGRLMQMRQLWEDAAQNYFEPSRFMLALQNCITTSRTVTFILQSHKSEIYDFEKWYAPHQDRWKNDPIMKWAKDARNTIEKRGDLETHSQVRAQIIASYLDDGPTTDWMPQELFSSPEAIWRSIPAEFRIPHVVEHGTLLIERRWVDSGLPDMEVLEALAHVYDDFCSTALDFLRSYDLKAPDHLDRSRPDVMGELAMDRAIYLAMSDGSVTGFRHYRKPMEAPTERETKRVSKRYGKAANWSRLKTAKTFRDVAIAYFENARVVIARDGYHRNFTFLMRGMQPIEIAQTDHPTRASRYVLMRDLAKLAHIAGADGVMMIGEVWTAAFEDVPPSGFAAEAKRRGEAIVLHAANAAGESFVLSSAIIRRRQNSNKVKSVSPMKIDEEGFQFMFMPFFVEWGCVDHDAFDKACAREVEMLTGASARSSS